MVAALSKRVEFYWILNKISKKNRFSCYNFSKVCKNSIWKRFERTKFYISDPVTLIYNNSHMGRSLLIHESAIKSVELSNCSENPFVHPESRKRDFLNFFVFYKGRNQQKKLLFGHKTFRRTQKNCWKRFWGTEISCMEGKIGIFAPFPLFSCEIFQFSLTKNTFCPSILRVHPPPVLSVLKFEISSPSPLP